MPSTLMRAIVGAIGFMVLDGIWLGVVMKAYYRDQLAPLARMAEGGMAPNWYAALMVYLLLGVGIATLAIPRASTLGSAAAYGALLGLVIYGVYDFTNLSTLRQWPLALTFIDWAWGGFAAALCTMVVWIVAR